MKFGIFFNGYKLGIFTKYPIKCPKDKPQYDISIRKDIDEPTWGDLQSSNITIPEGQLGNAMREYKKLVDKANNATPKS